MESEMQKIFDRFSTDFNSIFMYMSGKQKKEIAYLSPTLFIRWYYSALFSETILSPSAIVESQDSFLQKDRGFYSFCVHFDNVSGERVNFTFKKEFYSLDDHPIYKDIDVFMDYMNPALYLSDKFVLKEKDIHNLQKQLSVSDRYYVNYIFNLVGKLGLYKSIPSLTEPCICSDTSCGFFSLSSHEKFKRIYNSSLNICAEMLNKELPYDLNPIDSPTLESFLRTPISIDDMFVSLYDNVGIDIRDIWKKADNSTLDGVDSSILSSLLYMGILTDRAFIYIFGHYLRLIRPLYSYKINFKEIINSLFTSIAIGGEQELELFVPCTSYTLTPLGKLFFNGTSANKISPIPIDKILLSLNAENHLNLLDIDNSENSTNRIYTIKACYANNKRLWKIIEIESNIPVELAANYILTMFLLPVNKKYIIKSKSKNKKEIIYVPFKCKDDFVLPFSDLLNNDNNLITFINDREHRIELKLSDEHDFIDKIVYPRILSQSKELTEYEHNLFL